MFQILKIKYNW